MIANPASPWLQQYRPGIRWDAPMPASDVGKLLEDAVRRWPEQPALEFMDRVINFKEYGALVERFAAGLQQHGVGPGIKVGLYLPNSPHFAIALFGILYAGGTVVNYSPLDAERMLAHKIEESNTDLIVTLDLESLYPQLSRQLGSTRLKKLIVGNLGDFSSAPNTVREELEQSGQLAKVSMDDHHLSFLELTDCSDPLTRHELPDPQEAVAALQYTGGTTGSPKGAMITHANLCACIEQIFIATAGGESPRLLEGQERMLLVLPLFHIFGVNSVLLGARLGANVLFHARFDMESVLKDLHEQRITIFSGVPTMFTAMIQHRDFQNLDLQSLRVCFSGGAAMPVEVRNQFAKLTGCEISEGWGMTETTGPGTSTLLAIQHKPGSCGIPYPGIRLVVRSLDDPMLDVAEGEPGELCISGPNVIHGYWNAPEASDGAFTDDGFFRTGDIARMDEDGHVYIMDRSKDMLLCGGYNVYPRVIEEAIYEHPAVAEVCVIGIPDEYRGQSPKAFVVPKEGATVPDLKELQQFLASRLGKHEMVRAIEVRSSLPKTPAGKLSKQELIEEESRASSK